MLRALGRYEAHWAQAFACNHMTTPAWWIARTNYWKCGEEYIKHCVLVGDPFKHTAGSHLAIRLTGEPSDGPRAERLTAGSADRRVSGQFTSGDFPETTGSLLRHFAHFMTKSPGGGPTNLPRRWRFNEDGCLDPPQNKRLRLLGSRAVHAWTWFRYRILPRLCGG